MTRKILEQNALAALGAEQADGQSVSTSTEKARTKPVFQLTIDKIRYIPTQNSFIVNEEIWINKKIMASLMRGAGIATSTHTRHLVGSVLKYDKEAVKAGDMWYNEGTGESGQYHKDSIRYSNFDLEPSADLDQKLGATTVNVFDFMAE